MSTTEAIPLVRSKKASQLRKEFDSRSQEPAQKPTIVMPPLGVELERTPEIVVAEGPFVKQEIEKLAFNEEPMTILIHRSHEKFSPRCTDMIAINGVKAEMLFRQGWTPMGYLPRGQAFITRRKYVEVLASSKMDNIQTQVEDLPGGETRNLVDRIVTSTCTFSVIEDKNPAGVEWLTRLLQA
jgi:hypothetical protein